MGTRSRIFKCAWCLIRVAICDCCDDGQAYCGKICSQLGRLRSLKRAGTTYQNTKRGKFKHADRQRRYRARQKELKKVTHHPCTQQTICDNPPINNGSEIRIDENLAGIIYQNTKLEELNHIDRQGYYQAEPKKVTHHPCAQKTICDELSINNEPEMRMDENREATCCLCGETVSL